MRAPRVRPARHVIRWFLKATGYGAICLPPRGIYILRERMMEGDLLNHEAAHWAQAVFLGVAKFYWNYLKLLIRHGYKQHPMEQI